MKTATLAGLALSGLFLTQSTQAPDKVEVLVPPHPEPFAFTYSAMGYPHEKEVVIELVPGSVIEEEIRTRTGERTQVLIQEASTLKTAWAYSMTPYYASYRDDETTRGWAYSDKLTEYKFPIFMSPAEHVSHRRLMDLMDSISGKAAHVPFRDPQILCAKKEYEIQFRCEKFERK